ncbi:hypothetical protein ABEB36_005361 [Hypothenemus hampei]|uniref:Cyclin-like domain-containing protein n=1 Tax=Hypothenemus hampei TaxID=57062 RepID=A0ABD1F102_HYPHA
MQYLIHKASSSYFHCELWNDTDEYRESFKQVIKQREKIQIPFLHNSTQLEYRPGIVNYLRKICTDRKFSHCCLHLAIYLIDIFMDCHDIKPEKILLFANICLLLSAKFEENTYDVPKISELNGIVQNRYQITEYKYLEIEILKYFQWYIRFPTVAHYTHYFMGFVIEHQDLELRKNANTKTLFYDIHENVRKYLDHVIGNVHYMQEFKPSQLAASILAASRTECGLELWTHSLQQLTDYSKSDLQGPLYTLHLNSYREKIGPIPELRMVCTFQRDYCKNCQIKSCHKCLFLRKI